MFQFLCWFVGCWAKLKVLCTVKVCIVIVNDKVSAHHRLFVSGHQSRDSTGEKSFSCLNFFNKLISPGMFFFVVDQFNETILGLHFKLRMPVHYFKD